MTWGVRTAALIARHTVMPERPSSDQPWSGMCSSLNVPEGADTTWEIHLTRELTWLTVFLFSTQETGILACN